MMALLEIREYIKKFYIKYELYITYLWKFLLALIAISMINSYLGYMEAIKAFPIVLMAALLCSIMPKNFMVFVSAVFIVVHLYKLAPECAMMGGVILILMYLLYLRFSPKDTIAVMITPMLFFLHLPYLIPIALGLLGTPVSIVTMAFGVVAAYMISYFSNNALEYSSGADIEETANAFKEIINGIFGDKGMMAIIVAFAITIVVVYVVRRLSVDHSWKIAIFAGSAVDLVVLLVCSLVLNTTVNYFAVIIGIIVSGLLMLVLEFFAFNLDYTRTENVQFEDDEYYYYVKAVPKVTIASPQKKVKKINKSRSGSRKRED